MSSDQKTSKRLGWYSWRRWLVIAVVLFAAYFINLEVQTVLGERALAATHLESIDFDQALGKALAEKKWVLVDISAIWCPRCRSLDKQVFSDSQVRSVIESHYIFSRVEYESPLGEAILERYNVTGFPTLLLINGSGQLVERLPVMYDPIAFRELLKDYL